MKCFYCHLLFLILTLNCHAQKVKRFEHWDDRYNVKDSIEMQKSRVFLDSNNIKILEIYNLPEGIKGILSDSLPYAFRKNGDTLTYLIPGWASIKTREEFKKDILDNEQKHPYFIEKIRGDGRIEVDTFREYKFLLEKNLLYFLWYEFTLDIEEIFKIYQRLLASESKHEKEILNNEILSHRYIEKELIFDFDKQNKIGKKLKLDSKRYSQLLDSYSRDGKEYFKFKTKITSLGYNGDDNLFIIDRDCNFYLIDGQEIKY